MKMYGKRDQSVELKPWCIWLEANIVFTDKRIRKWIREFRFCLNKFDHIYNNLPAYLDPHHLLLVNQKINIFCIYICTYLVIILLSKETEQCLTSSYLNTCCHSQSMYICMYITIPRDTLWSESVGNELLPKYWNKYSKNTLKALETAVLAPKYRELDVILSACLPALLVSH